jgi:transposase
MGWTQPHRLKRPLGARMVNSTIRNKDNGEGPTVEVTTIGIDLAKNVFGVHGVDARGRVSVRKRLVRNRLLEFLSKLPPCLVGLEACGSAHYWARKIEQLGHRVKLMSPRFVKAYRKNDKNDANDAEAICEAVTRPSMRFVPLKSEAQQDIQALHRVREQLLKSRTALVNQVRGLLGEHGIVAPRGISSLRRLLVKILADPERSGLSEFFGGTLVEIAERLRFLDQRIRAYDLRIERLFQNDERCQRLAKVEGVGPMVATALVAAVGNASEFTSGRELSAWLGLVPRQHSSGNRNVLLGISKRGDRYLRTLMIHGARAALRTADRKRDRRSLWVSRLRLERGPNVAAVALANKNARILWALLTRGDSYRPATISDRASKAEPTAAFRHHPPTPVGRAVAEGSFIKRI